MRYLLAGAFFICASVLILSFMYTDFKRPEWAPALQTNQAFQENLRESVMILLWTKVFKSWREHFPPNSGDLVYYNNCKVPCFLTKDRSLVRTVNAVLIHDRDVDSNDLPEYRAEQQRWVYWNWEAPTNSRIKGIKKLTDAFNWTYTYRHDSDVPYPYFHVRRRAHAHSSAPPLATSTNRSKLVVWAVSNCKASSGRQEFVQELQKYIPVDIYGHCGKLKCPQGPECLAHFGKTYYFYLALENSICPEYVTEKFYNALLHRMVPVVFGNYSEIGPPGSYVNALEFPSPKHVATYLKAVAADPCRYKEYFAWRRTHDIYPHNFTNHCTLCEALYKARPQDRKVYKDINNWWYGDGSQCTSWK